MGIAEALKRTTELPSQTQVDVVRGMTVRRTKAGIVVGRLHYSCIPDRDPETPEGAKWREAERRKYTSDASWQREMEIVDAAGGGELVFADTLVTHWSKIVITDPRWRPDKRWKVVGGFDHGRRNPTALLRCYIDHDGNKFVCGEYYVPGKDVWQHAPELLKMPDVDRFDVCWSDPTVFDQKTQQSPGKEARAIAELYFEQGVHFLTRFDGNRNDQTFASRLLAHWADLENRDPQLYIVCHNYSDSPQFGMHPWSCPNLLWELMRTRRRKLSAQQLLTKNVSEEIVDKDNHLRDSLKGIIMSLPDPTEYTTEEKIQKRLSGLDPTTAMIKYMEAKREIEEEDTPTQFPIGRLGVLHRLAR